MRYPQNQIGRKDARFIFFFFSVREENKKEGRLSREETMEMLRADDSDSEESAIFNAKTDR